MPSPDQREYAARLLRKAGEDLAVVRVLIENESERALNWAHGVFDGAP